MDEPQMPIKFLTLKDNDTDDNNDDIDSNNNNNHHHRDHDDTDKKNKGSKNQNNKQTPNNNSSNTLGGDGTPNSSVFSSTPFFQAFWSIWKNQNYNYPSNPNM